MHRDWGASQTYPPDLVSIPSLRIFACSVVRFMPSLAAAPCIPADACRRHSRSARWMASLSAAASVTALDAATGPRLELAHRRLQRGAGRKNHRALDEVLQFADVAGPVVARQRLHGFGRDVGDAPVHAAGVLLHEVAHQQRNIVAPFAQRRHRDGEDVEAVVEIGAELPLLHQLLPGRDWWRPPGGRRCGWCASCPGARIRAPAGRAAAWSAVPAESRRLRPGTWCRGGPARSARCAARWRR